MIRLALALVIAAAVAAPAAAEPLRAVVRHAGAGDELAVARLDGHVVDLDVTPIAVEGPLEPTLDAQIAAAARLAARHDAAAVVWFRAEDGGLAVVVATPRDRRVFARTIDGDDASAIAEAAAQAARTALRALTLGGTIGVEVPEPVPVPQPALDAPVPDLRVRGALGYQLTRDAGADAGAHAITQRLTLSRGPWAATLALSLGPPLRRADAATGVTVELSRSSLLLGAEHRRGPLTLAALAGAVVYHRATVATPDGLDPTDGRAAVSFAAGPELRYAVRLGRGVAVDLTLGLDLVAAPPTLAIDRAGTTETIADLATLQPRAGLSLVLGATP